MGKKRQTDYLGRDQPKSDSPFSRRWRRQDASTQRMWCLQQEMDGSSDYWKDEDDASG